jgi:NAD+ kinase
MNAPQPRIERVALFGRPDDPPVAEAMRALAAHLAGRGCRVLVARGLPVGLFASPVDELDEEELAPAADLVVAIGGDGTMLRAARHAAHVGKPLLGVNRGRLGFLADLNPERMLDGVDDALAGRCLVEQRLMLHSRLQSADTIIEGLSLNDVVVSKLDTGRMLELRSWIDGVFVNTHGGDGFIVATSTGSTAYALSCGGPIIHPALAAIVLAPICPHTLSDRPIVVGADASVDIELVERSETRAQVVCDGRPLAELAPGARLTVRRAAAAVALLHPPGHDYYRTLRSKLHWGRSARRGSQVDPD